MTDGPARQSSLPATFADLLASIERRQLRRETRTSPRESEGGRDVDFSSNDYLGLSRNPRLIEAMVEGARRHGVGAGAARLMSGNYEVHGLVEEAVARFKGSESAVLYPSGYGANTGLIPVLAGPETEVFSDELNHASIVDGIRLSRARMTTFRHNDPEDLAEKMGRSRAKRMVVVTEGVFSMDGDVAPLPEIVEACGRSGAWLVVDEAHATGVLGPGGRGTFAEYGILPPEDAVQVVTLGKAVGVAGGAVAGPRTLCRVLQSRSRSWIFSTAPPPAVAAAVLEGFRVLADEPGTVTRLRARCGYLADRLLAMGIPVEPRTPIFPVIIGDESRALEIAEQLRTRGLFVQAVRPPTVPRGTSRLRISVSADHTEEDLDRLMTALGELR